MAENRERWAASAAIAFPRELCLQRLLFSCEGLSKQSSPCSSSRHTLSRQVCPASWVSVWVLRPTLGYHGYLQLPWAYAVLLHSETKVAVSGGDFSSDRTGVTWGSSPLNAVQAPAVNVSYFEPL